MLEKDKILGFFHQNELWKKSKNSHILTKLGRFVAHSYNKCKTFSFCANIGENRRYKFWTNDVLAASFVNTGEFLGFYFFLILTKKS